MASVGFRHTLATRTLNRQPTKIVSEILGHSAVRTTLRTYQHIETEDFRVPSMNWPPHCYVMLRNAPKSSKR